MPTRQKRARPVSLPYGKIREKILFPARSRAAGAEKPIAIRGLCPFARRRPAGSAGKIASLPGTWQGNGGETVIANIPIIKLTKKDNMV
jgi:hypothetical protein